MKNIKKYVASTIAIFIFATGCQKAPESSIVKNKNMDKMIEEAKQTDASDENIEDIAQKYDTYQDNIVDKKNGVKVNVDAKVEIPQTQKMSIVRVEQTKITDELIKKIQDKLMEGDTLYDGTGLSKKTKADLIAEIQFTKDTIEEIKQEYANDEDSKKVYLDEYNTMLNKLKKEYEKAPKEIDWSKYKPMEKLESVKDKYESNKDDSFYSWEYSINETGKIYYNITYGDNEKYKQLYAQNNEDSGNCIRFYSSKNTYSNITSSVVASYVVGLDTNYGMWPADREPTDEDTIVSLDGGQKINYEDEINEKLTISKEKADEIVNSFLEEIGLNDYKCSQSGKYNEILQIDMDENNTLKSRQVYYYKYLRTIDGVFVNNEFGQKYQEGWSGNTFTKKMWPGESIDICVNDDGIVTFNYNVPIKENEVVVEKAKLKSFEKVKKVFEKMVPTIYAVTDAKEDDVAVTINISNVVLRYMRISEKDSFDTGLLVPVWDFMGTRTFYSGYKDKEAANEHSIITINAIDGSVIDKDLGY